MMVFGAIPRISAISEMVKPSIHIISEYISKKLDFFRLLNINIDKNAKKEKISNICLRFSLLKSNSCIRFR
jgi:hypothetical protein